MIVKPVVVNSTVGHPRSLTPGEYVLEERDGARYDLGCDGASPCRVWFSQLLWLVQERIVRIEGQWPSVLLPCGALLAEWLPGR